MKVGSKEFYDILAEFEKTFNQLNLSKNDFPEDHYLYGKVSYYYCNGETNNLFNAFLKGVSLGRCFYNQ